MSPVTMPKRKARNANGCEFVRVATRKVVGLSYYDLKPQKKKVGKKGMNFY